MLSRTVSMLPVVAYDEIVLGTEVEPIDTISINLDVSREHAENEIAMASK